MRNNGSPDSFTPILDPRRKWNDLQRSLSSDGDGDRRIAHRADRADGRTLTMLLMIHLLCSTLVQQLARCEHQGHQSQERPRGDEAVRVAEHPRRK